MTLKRIVTSITLFALISTHTACQRRTIADGRIKVTISSSLVDEYFKDIIDEFEVKYPHIGYEYKTDGINLLSNNSNAPGIPYRGTSYDRHLLYEKISVEADKD